MFTNPPPFQDTWLASFPDTLQDSAVLPFTIALLVSEPVKYYLKYLALH